MVSLMICLLCPTHPKVDLDHFRLFHPDRWDGVESWPDGRPIVHEELTPDAAATSC
jgi:hypothetical protein